MATFLNLFGMGEAGKPVGESEIVALETEVPNHLEDASQGSEFLDDILWETDQSLNTSGQNGSDVNQ